MADDRSITGSAATEDDVHDDDELAEVLAAELERYATGTVPTVPRPVAGREEPMQPLAVPRLEPQQREPAQPQPAEVADGAFARRAAEVERAMRQVSPADAAGAATPESFRRAERPSGRRSATGPILQPGSLPTADDLPVKRRTGFRPPPSAVAAPQVEPLDRVLPTGPVSLPEATATLLDSMISDATGPVQLDPAQHARHAAPAVEPEPQTGPLPGPALHTGTTGSADGLYEDWEQSLRSIGRPPAPWEQDDVLIPTGGDPDLPTVAIPVQGTGPLPQPEPQARRGAHALPAEPVTHDVVSAAAEPPARRRRSGRRRADAPDDAVPDPESSTAPVTVPVEIVQAGFSVADLEAAVTPGYAHPHTEPFRSEPFRTDAASTEQHDVVDDDSDDDDEGIDEVAVDYPVVSAATTGAIDLPQVEPRPRTAPLLIERVRTAILQLPTVPTSPTGSGAAAIVGRWFGAFASPLTLVLAFGLVAAGSGSAAAVAVLAGAVLAAPALVRTAAWSARAGDDGAMQEAAVLGAAGGRAVAVLLLLVRLGAAATVLFFAGSTAGGWADRTGALGLGSSNAALIGCAVVAVLAILVAAMPARATAVLTLLAGVAGAIGTLLIALVLAPNGGAPIATTASGAVAGVVGGFVGVGLLLVLCGADVARWRTDIAEPVSTAVGSVVAVVLGGVLVCAGTLIASRLSAGGDAVDEFAGALSDASAGALAAPLLVILLLSAVTLPVLLLRSAGASAARLLGSGRPVRLGAVAAGLLALAGALGLLAAGVDPTAAALSAAALCGVPVAAWAGVLMTTSSARRGGRTAIVLGVAVLVGWSLSDGIVPGAASPVLEAISSSTSGLRGGPAVGVAAALVIGAVAGLVGGSARRGTGRSVAGPADTVEG